jgi:hypothetical protein
LAQNYTEVFSDDFNRLDGTDVGNDWTETNVASGDWLLSAGHLYNTWSAWSGQPIIHPTTETLLNGKAEFIAKENATVGAPAIVARYYNGDYYIGWWHNDDNSIALSKVINNSDPRKLDNRIKFQS